MSTKVTFEKWLEGDIFISQGCPNRLPQTGWLTTTGIHPFQFRGQESKIKMSTGLDPSGGSLTRLAPGFWWFPTIYGAPWLIEASLQPHMAIYTWPSSLCFFSFLHNLFIPGEFCLCLWASVFLFSSQSPFWDYILVHPSLHLTLVEAGSVISPSGWRPQLWFCPTSCDAFCFP